MRSPHRHDRTAAPGPLRVAIVAESFLPNVNGVTNSVLRVVEHLTAHGHHPVVVAPGPGATTVGGTEVIRIAGIDVPRYDDLRVGLPSLRMTGLLKSLRPDVVHAAAPVVMGATALRSARRLGIPSVAVFQTDLAGFARRHGLAVMGDRIWAYLRRIHGQADVTLAPSTSTVWMLRSRGFERVSLWGRGVDLDRFHPRNRCDTLRRRVAPRGETIIGYVGRLAKEKQVERLAPLARHDGYRVVVVGDGPERDRLESLMPAAVFTGFRSGEELSRWHASFDLFVHTGLDETFCQALQESMASGVPAVAPSAGGPLDLVRHGTTGYLWSPDDPGTLLGAVAELADHPDLRHRLGASARAEAEQRPWSTVLDRLVHQYRAVIDGGPARRGRLRRVA